MLQIGLLVWGVVILVKGKVTLTKNKTVVGIPARVIGIMFVSLFPLAFVFGIVLGTILAATNTAFNPESFLFIDFGLIGLAVLAAFLIAAKYGTNPNEELPAQPTSEFAPPPRPGQAPVDPDNPFSSPQFDDR